MFYCVYIKWKLIKNLTLYVNLITPLSKTHPIYRVELWIWSAAPKFTSSWIRPCTHYNLQGMCISFLCFCTFFWLLLIWWSIKCFFQNSFASFCYFFFPIRKISDRLLLRDVSLIPNYLWYEYTAARRETLWVLYIH